MKQYFRLFVVVLLLVGVYGLAAVAQVGTPLPKPTSPATPAPATTTTPPPLPQGEGIPPAGAPGTEPTPPAPAPPATTPPTTTPENPNAIVDVTYKPLPDLKVFGRDLFRSADNAFIPAPDAPVPPDYILGAGDTLAVTVWYGASEYENSTSPVSPKGDIYLKLIGSVPMAHKTLAQVEEELKQRYARFYTKFNLRVQVVGQRTIPIFVMGEVVKPGKYMLSSLSTVFTALFSAQGPTDIGSLRRIRLLRGTQVVKDIDVYQYLVRGEVVDTPLKAGDTIFVSMAGKVVAVAGEVRRPAKYELLEKDTLREALTLAGGTAATSAEHLRVARIGANQQREVVDLTLPQDAGFELRDGDEIQALPVLPYIRNAVFLRGAVNRAGDFPIEKAPTVSALLELADGTAPDAYLEQAILYRMENNSFRKQVPVNLRAVLEKDATADLTLQPGDLLRVYKRGELMDLLDIVTVKGEVVKPEDYPYQTGMRVADLVRLSFGLTTEAYIQQALLYRYPIGASSQMISINLAKALEGDAKENLVLQPRDRLIIKSRQAVKDQLVMVQGEVETPGPLPFHEGMKVSDALFLVGGLKPNVALDRALLIRLNEQTYAEELMEISLRGVLAKDAKHDVVLRNNDRLVVFSDSQMGDRRVVSVEGAVVEPGNYTFIGEMRISHLLFLAKGLRQDAYAQRADLYRLLPDNTTQIIPVDLVAAIAGEKPEANPALQPRDRLVISTIGEMEEARVVKIDGYVRKPGEYRLTVGMKLSDLLHLAGGLKPDAVPEVSLYRSGGDTQATSFKVQLTDSKITLAVDPLLQPNDLISVHGNANYVSMTETVTLDGEVEHPGVYPAYDGSRQKPKTLYELLKGAGGSLADSYPAGIVLYRKQAAIHTDRQQAELIRTMRTLDASVGIPVRPEVPTPEPSTPNVTPDKTNVGTTATPAATGTTPPTGTEAGGKPASMPAAPATPTAAEIAKDQSVNSISTSIAKVMTTDQGNTVVLVIPPRSMQDQQFSLSLPIDAEPIIRSQGKVGDITLEPGDYVYVPKRPTTVTVLGGVTNSSSVVYQSGKALDYYLTAVGGVASDGDGSRIVIMRMNGLVLPVKQVKEIRPGDIVIVPTKHMLKMIHTKSGFERVLQTISQAALSFLPFKQ